METGPEGLIEPVPYPVPSLEDLRAHRRVILFTLQNAAMNGLSDNIHLLDQMLKAVDLGIEQAEKEIDNLRKDGGE